VISVGTALAEVLQAAAPLAPERTALLGTLGRVAAEDIASTRTVPAAANSAMDGYAVRHQDLGPAPLRVVAIVPAGSVPETPVTAGTAVKLFTGSVIPSGADTVVRIEDVEKRDDDAVLVLRPPARGANVRPAGEDVQPGQVVVTAGTVIGPADIGVLASLGRTTMLVHQRPRVTILSTGSELVEVDETPGPAQVVNTNAYALAAAVRDAGGEPVVLPIVRDRPEDLEGVLAEAARADVMLTSGGVSVGDLDYVRGALDALGVERVFWGVAQKPGKPLTFGRFGRRLVFGLPGNPVSALVCFYLYVRPALRRLQGHRRVHLPVTSARLARPVRKAAGLTEFVRVQLAETGDGLVATALPAQGSGVLSALAGGAALLIGPADTPELAAGVTYRVILLGDSLLARETPPF
jgi:molybdopterin molybdotransferase